MSGSHGYDFPRLNVVRILLADDMPEWREIIRAAFESCGADIVDVGDGEAALHMLVAERAHGTPFHAVLLDICMPQMNGLRVLKQLRGMPSVMHTPVVVLTTENALPEVKCCKEIGVQGYLLKPFKPHRLLEIVDAAVRDSVVKSANWD